MSEQTQYRVQITRGTDGLFPWEVVVDAVPWERDRWVLNITMTRRGARRWARRYIRSLKGAPVPDRNARPDVVEEWETA